VRTAGAFVIGLVIVIVVLEVIKNSQYNKYAWTYVGIILLGMMVFNRAGLTLFANDLQAKLKGG
jgi:hypothetical protein